MRRPALRLARAFPGWLAAGVCASAATIGWLGYRAVHNWQDSAALLAERRAAETAELLATALRRDMRGVQATVLSSANLDEFMLDPPYDVRTLVASAFARYPYPESFFAWRGAATPDAVVFLNRSDRRPPWMPGPAEPARFPVVVDHAPAVARALLDRIREDAEQGRRFSIFEMAIGEVPCQIVARLLYRDALREQLEGVFGFTVNLAWVRRAYFPELTRQVAQIGAPDAGLSLDIVDEDATAAVHGPGEGGTVTTRRAFSMSFFDPALVELDPPPDLSRRSWAVEVRMNDAALGQALRGANRTLAIAALAAGTLVLGLVLSVRAARASARLAEMRSEFVSTVTHELKTPIATIRAAGDTLAHGRLTDPEVKQEYAALVVQESKRLTRLVDNLLAYSRLTDVTEAYLFEPLSVGTLIEDSLQGFGAQLDAAEFRVDVDVPADVPPIRADRTAIILALDNLIDNAIRYSRDVRALHLDARVDAGRVVVRVHDRGIGIPPEELPQVTRRFFRGRDATSGGSGLGLAIATRIISDHDGRLTIESTLGEGTTVLLILPAARTAHGDPHPAG